MGEKIKLPSKQTLRKYGLTIQDWKILLQECNYVCPICERKFGRIYNGKRPLSPVIDHVHVRNFKRMSAENKKKFVRGVPCNYCNRRRLGRGMDLKTARNIVMYLELYEKRNPSN